MVKKIERGYLEENQAHIPPILSPSPLINYIYFRPETLSLGDVETYNKGRSFARHLSGTYLTLMKGYD
jgi:hypothetical protein